MLKTTFVIEIDEHPAMIKSIKEVLQGKGYDAKFMEGGHFKPDEKMDTLEVIRINYNDYPKGSEIILISKL